MKLLMTTDTLGGVWTYCMELCTALGTHGADEGIHIALATMGRKLSPDQRHQVSKLAHVQLYESEYRLCWMQDPWEDVERAGEWLLDLEHQVQPNVVHLNDLGHGNLAWQSPVLLLAHSCVLSWWDAVKKQPAPDVEWGRYQQVVRASVRRANLVAAPTHAMLVTLLRHYGPARASIVIPNGRDFPPLVSSPTAKTARAEPIIFTAGRVWDEAKNIAALAKISLQLSWPVYVAGEQQNPDGSTQNHPELTCLGFLQSDALTQWLEKASIYVAPAHYEPFGLSILEAARAGCALVLGNIKSLREVWGDAAEYVDPDNPAQLREIINALIENPPYRQLMAERAWQRAQRYSAAQMASDYLHCYDSLITGRTRVRHSSIQNLIGTRL